MLNIYSHFAQSG